ncbi:MAG: hypothetical protein ACREHD_06975, partial [Pirellulales bacterium]
MKRAIAVLATGLLLSGAIYMGRDRGDPRGGAAATAADSPTECLERLFASAEKGDVPGWLDCFTGQERDRLGKEIASQPTGEFAAALQDAVRTLKGRAINDMSGNGPQGDAAVLSVERIYAHHTERQRYHFRRERDGWRIESLGAVEKHQP